MYLGHDACSLVIQPDPDMSTMVYGVIIVDLMNLVCT